VKRGHIYVDPNILCWRRGRKSRRKRIAERKRGRRRRREGEREVC
jgi:hypothetical protein